LFQYDIARYKFGTIENTAINVNDVKANEIVLSFMAIVLNNPNLDPTKTYTVSAVTQYNETVLYSSTNFTIEASNLVCICCNNVLFLFSMDFRYNV